MAVLGKMAVETLDFGFATPKRHFLARNRVVWRILRQNRCARLGCSLSQEPQKIAESLCAEGREITHAQTETPKPMWIKFCTMVDITDVVTHTNFGDHWLRVFLGSGGSNFPLSHWLSSSSLQHCRTTVRACDVRTFLYEKCDVGRIINHSIYRRRSCCNKDYSARRRLVGAW